MLRLIKSSPRRVLPSDADIMNPIPLAPPVSTNCPTPK